MVRTKQTARTSSTGPAAQRYHRRMRTITNCNYPAAWESEGYISSLTSDSILAEQFNTAYGMCIDKIGRIHVMYMNELMSFTITQENGKSVIKDISIITHTLPIEVEKPNPRDLCIDECDVMYFISPFMSCIATINYELKTIAPFLHFNEIEESLCVDQIKLADYGCIAVDRNSIYISHCDAIYLFDKKN